jgi:urocanate hydratase
MRRLLVLYCPKFLGTLPRNGNSLLCNGIRMPAFGGLCVFGSCRAPDIASVHRIGVFRPPANCAILSTTGKRLLSDENRRLVRLMATGAANGSTRTVERALDLLGEVCAEGDITLSECARRVALPASTALRLLRTLEAVGFVVRDETGSFSAGPRLIQLGASALGRQSLVRLAEPGMQRIVAATGESTYLAMHSSGDTAIYVAMVEGTRAVRHTSWVGRSVPLAKLALGRALRGEVGECGYVAERDRLEPDVTAVAAPIRRPGGIAGALSLLGPTYRIDDDAMHAFGRIVGREAYAVGEQLGVAHDDDTVGMRPLKEATQA